MNETASPSGTVERLRRTFDGGRTRPFEWRHRQLLAINDMLERRIDDIARAGSMIGSGAVVVMDDTTNLVAAAHRIVRFFAHESCGQCTPCREGTTWLEQILTRILSGYGRPSDIDLLLDVSDNISPGLGWPPAMTTSASPHLIACAARCTALRPLPQSLLIVIEVHSCGMPASMAAWRAGFWPVPAVRICPSRTSSTSAASVLARRRASLMATVPR